MLYINSLWDVAGSIIVFILGLGIAMQMCGYFKTTSNRAIILYLWHTLFCLLYIWFITTYGGDAVAYYKNGLTRNLDFSLGTGAVTVLTSYLSSIFGLSFFATSLVYNIFGFIGLLAFDASLHFITSQKNKAVCRFAEFIVFLPSISFWSSGIGKDSLAFLSIGLVLWGALNVKKRVLIIIPAILIMLLVRPHIAGVLVFAFGFSMLLYSRISLLYRYAIGVLAITAFVFLIPLGMNYTKTQNISNSKDIEKYIHTRALYNMQGGGGVDISNMPIPLQVVTYLFRPLPFEAKNVPFLVVSLENIVLLYLFIIGVNAIIKKRYRSSGENRFFMWIYSLITLLMLSTTTANLGISVRQKWMFTPMLIFLMISVIGKRQVPRKSLT